jgi:hypothetical protein
MKKVIAVWGITYTSKREPKLYIKLRNLVRMVCMVNVSISFGVHIDRKHAYTYKILVLSDNYLLMLSAARKGSRSIGLH